MLRVKEDIYNGWIVEPDSIEEDLEVFESSLNRLIEQAGQAHKKLIWMDFMTTQANQIALALKRGFIFHNCEPHRTTLIYQVQSDAYIPVPPTHTIGVGAVVINAKQELLMVRDRIGTRHSLYKLPGGMVEEGDRLLDGVIREVYEETGIHAKFIKMVSILNSHPYRYNKSNMYIVFALEPLDEEINIIDTEEIEEAIWMPLEKFFAHEEMSTFQKDLVKQSLSKEGLSLLDEEAYFGGKKHVEVYA